MEQEIRLAAFDWLNEQLLLNGETLPRTLLAQGFPYHGDRVTLIGASGIWKPRQFEIIPISITSTVKGPYDDAFSEDGHLIYRYRGEDPSHRDNVGLQEAMRTRTPLIYFYGVIPGRYLPVWPIWWFSHVPSGYGQVRSALSAERDVEWRTVDLKRMGERVDEGAYACKCPA